MYIEFGSMIIEDFKAFRGKHSIALNGVGVVFVIGENQVTARLSGNGAAKSTLWDALTWCLYGKTPLGLRSTDVKPWVGGKPCVTVALTIDGADHVCQRTTSPKNLFTVNEQERADISEVLPISFDLFVNTVLLPQERPLFFDLEPSKKMAHIAEAQQLERWDRRSEAAAQAATNIEAEANDLLEEQRGFEARLAELNRVLAEARERSKTWGDEARKRIQVSKTAIAALEKEHKRKSDELDKATLDEDGALLEVRQGEAKLNEQQTRASRVIGDLRGVGAEIDLLASRASQLEQEIENISQAKRCPTCGQPVKAANLKEHRQHLYQQHDEVRVKAAGKIQQRKKIAAEGAALEGMLERQIKAIEGFREKANAASDIVTRLSPEVATLKRQLLDAQGTKEEINPYLDQIRQHTERRKALLADFNETKADVADAQARLEQARYWVKGFKEIKLKLIEEVLQELELVTNSMIEEVGLEGWEVRCDIERETKSGTTQRAINIEIKSPESTGFVKWASWSGGERQRLKLIGSLALSDVLLAHVGVETNLEVLDEPAVYWASEGVQELCAFLAERAREREKTIFYIEHQAVESTAFSEVLRVVKDKKGAYIA